MSRHDCPGDNCRTCTHRIHQTEENRIFNNTRDHDDHADAAAADAFYGKDY